MHAWLFPRQCLRLNSACACAYAHAYADAGAYACACAYAYSRVREERPVWGRFLQVANASSGHRYELATATVVLLPHPSCAQLSCP